jgi:hypothetical protein
MVDQILLMRGGAIQGGGVRYAFNFGSTRAHRLALSRS